ncbi:hypothetical protein STEG23_028452, partial [Scotinomys teguina]
MVGSKAAYRAATTGVQLQSPASPELQASITFQANQSVYFRLFQIIFHFVTLSPFHEAYHEKNFQFNEGFKTR